MNQDKIVEALRVLPEKELVNLLNEYFDLTDMSMHIYTNTRTNLNKVCKGLNPCDIVHAIENGETKYNRLDKWFLYDETFEDVALYSANTVKELVSDLTDYLVDMAEAYLEGDLPEWMNEIIEAALEKREN